ncbi:MAG: hypothetical protein U0528_13235 [Anaerolineae bacterium]
MSSTQSTRLFVAVFAIALLLAPFSGSTTLAQTTVTREGAHLWGWQGAYPYGGDQQYIDFWAFKDTTKTTGSPPVSHAGLRLHLLGPGGASGGVLIAEDIFGFEGDQDLMSVSKDLGWAGIDRTVSLLDRNSGQMVKVEFHVYWWATGTKEAVGAGTRRWARVEGTIRIYGPHGFTINLPGYYPSTSDLQIFTHPL